MQHKNLTTSNKATEYLTQSLRTKLSLETFANKTVHLRFIKHHTNIGGDK